MDLDKTTLELLNAYKSEDIPEPKPDWYMAGSEKLKHFYDTAESQHERIIEQLASIKSPDDARKILNLIVSADNTRAYLNRKGLIETANQKSSYLKLSRSIVNRRNYTDMVAQLDNWDASIQAHYMPGGKHKVSRGSLYKSKLEAEKKLKAFDMELVRELNKSLQESTLLKANSEVKIQNKNLITENFKLMAKIQQLEITNASYEKQLAQASILNQELKKLQREVVKLSAENSILKSSKVEK